MTQPQADRPIEIRPALRQVLCDGVVLPLGARAFDVLLALASRAGQVVTKAELLDTVWAGLVVEENNLTVQISALRRALGPGRIVTVPGRGYQWTGAAPQAEGEAPRPAVAPALAQGPLADEARAEAGPGETRLFGRQAEHARLLHALQQPGAGRLVSVIGPAGIGKTALAQAIASAVAGADGAGSVCEAELAALAAQPPGSAAELDTTGVASAVAAALGVRGAGATALERVLRHLAHAAETGTLPRLLVLDNCEHVLAAAAVVCSAVRAAAPGLAVLTTSQAPLNLPDEQVQRLEALALPTADSVAAVAASAAGQLFCARAAAVHRRFRLDAGCAAAVAEICRRMEGVPLALELAAGRLPLLGVDGVRERLDERLRLLRGSDAQGEPRHRALVAALEWSHALLLPAEQALLRRLAVFAGSFTAGAAQQVADDAPLDRWAVLDALGVLVDKSLVAAQPERPAVRVSPLDEPRFLLLEAVRDYARARLDESGAAMATGRRHAEYFTALAEAHGGGMLGGALAARRVRVAHDIDNLRAALAWCLAHDAQLGLRLAAALALLWREHGLLAEGRVACAALLGRTAGDAPSPVRLAVQVTLGALAMEQDDAAQMQAMGEQVLEASRALGERRREAHGNGLLAHAALTRNDSAGAISHFQAALVIFRELGDGRGVAESLNNIAQCHHAEGRATAALALLREALPLARASNSRWTEAAVLQSLGDACTALGDEQAAWQWLAESLQLRRGVGHVQQVVMSLQSLALLEIVQRRLVAACGHLLEATRECARHGYGQLDGLCLLSAGAVAAGRGRFEDGARLLAAGCAGLDGTPVGRRPTVARVRDEACAAARAGLGSVRWQAAWEQGCRLGRDEGLTLAQAVLDDTGAVSARA